jgi:hypothetical protein
VGKSKWLKLCAPVVVKSSSLLIVTTSSLVGVKIVRALMEAQITLNAAERIYQRYTFGITSGKYSYAVLETMRFESLYLKDNYP